MKTFIETLSLRKVCLEFILDDFNLLLFSHVDEFDEVDQEQYQRR